MPYSTPRDPRPRIVFAGISGGGGKTIASLAVSRAWGNQGLRLAPFKKGPDYIDAAWLSAAASAQTANLDPYFLEADLLRAQFRSASRGAILSIIEGNRGLFDGKDVDGSCSTAELARLLLAPVVLVLDATKMTRTAAAIVAGCKNFEPGLNLAGVILNRTAGKRHRAILRESIESAAGVPVLGILPKLPENPIPERHMGLTSLHEPDAGVHDRERALDGLGLLAEEWIDLEALRRIAECAPPLPDCPSSPWPDQPTARQPHVRIGLVRDAALWFYYPENIEALQRAGAEIVPLSILDPAPWPEIHGLYLGGGFPETMAANISQNVTVRARVKTLAEDGLPIYAECGGFMYLCREIERDGVSHPMAGVFPLRVSQCVKPQGLGYTEAEVVAENPYHPLGARLKGHEFHYSRCEITPEAPADYALKLTRGRGACAGRDGLLHKNTLAGYNHIHALAAPHWAQRFTDLARGYAAARTSLS
ncbi:MAG: cobyrinate a,c-diamide synthase [Desulfovibrionaceae bacterium]